MYNTIKKNTLVQNIAGYWRDLSLTLKGTIVVALPLSLLLASLSLLYITELKLSTLENQLKVTLENQRDIQTVHSQLLEASTGVRDYLLTNDKGFLSVYYRAEKQLPNRLAQLDHQLESKSKKQKLHSIRTLVQQNLDYLKVMATDESDQASASLTLQFKSQIDSLKKLGFEIERLYADEALLVQKEQQNIASLRQRNFNITLFFVVIGIIGSVFAMWLFSNTIVKRVKLIRDSAGHLARAEALDLPSSSRDELGQLTDELEHASQLLAQNIHRATLAKQEAEEANQSKSRFLSRTSHELRTPLNAILGFAQLLEDDLPNGSDKDNVKTIKGAGEHLLKLINEVLDIARIESGEHAVTLKPIDINALLNEAVHYIAPLGSMRDIDITQNIEANLVGLANKQKLLQVVLNLLSNALKYGPVNTTVLLKAYRKNSRIVIEVFDEGVGIPADLKARLFTPFDRLGAEQSKIEGSGLGLALSKQIMQAMQGSIHVAEHSSLFWIDLQAADDEISPHNETPAPTTTTTAISSLKHPILYVEDNASNKALVEAIIKRQPLLTLHIVSTIKEAKTILTALEFSLCIIDLNLPDGSGEDLLTYMQSMTHLAQVPIMILSADALPETIDRLKNKGVQSYMTKPLNIAAFTEQVKQLTLD
jgi:signal transduction histidine kinase/ActR/RegA family two-component response regulator